MVVNYLEQIQAVNSDQMASHDGLDFGSVDHPGSEIHAVHGGKVVYVGNPGISGLGACVIVINYDGLNMVYQEFANSTGNSRVKVGDQVKVGQVIGIRDTAHFAFRFHSNGLASSTRTRIHR